MISQTIKRGPANETEILTALASLRNQSIGVAFELWVPESINITSYYGMAVIVSPLVPKGSFYILPEGTNQYSNALIDGYTLSSD